MRKILVTAAALTLGLGLASTARATNADNLIGIGPVARSMGGVGVAAPQDAISAVFANPAAMCFGPYCPGSEFNFAGSVFAPTVNGTIHMDANFNGPGNPPGAMDLTSESLADPFVIPVIGFSMPINTQWRFGLAAYGVSGMGVDYRDQLFGTPGIDMGEMFTQYQVMKFAPNLVPCNT